MGLRAVLAMALAGMVGGAADTGRAEETVVPVPAPTTRATAKVLDRLERIEDTLQTTEYKHQTSVKAKKGHYAWDCSGMANWILRRDAPRAYKALKRDRPVARTYWRIIDKAPTGRHKSGWKQIADIADVQPGDVFAWRRPPEWPPGGNTGHVGFVVEAPRRVTDKRWDGLRAFTVRVVDATSLPHQDDTRDPEGAGGFGSGTLLFAIDDTGRAYAYGWFGTRSRLIATDIVFGRLSG